MGVHPLVELRVAVEQAARGAFLVLFDVGPRIEVEVVVELGIRAPDGEDAELGGERAVVDVRRAPEVAAGRQVAELHHPGGAPDVVRLLTAIVVRDVVLPEIRRHAVEEGEPVRARIEAQHLHHATGRRRREEVGRGPVHVLVGVDHREPVALSVLVVGIGLDERGLAVVVEDEPGGAPRRGQRLDGDARRHEDVAARTPHLLADGDGTRHDEELVLRIAHAGRLLVAGLEEHGHGAGTIVGVERQHLVLHALRETRQGHLLERDIAVDEGFDMRTGHVSVLSGKGRVRTLRGTCASA